MEHIIWKCKARINWFAITAWNQLCIIIVQIYCAFVGIYHLFKFSYILYKLPRCFTLSKLSYDQRDWIDRYAWCAKSVVICQWKDRLCFMWCDPALCASRDKLPACREALFGAMSGNLWLDYDILVNDWHWLVTLRLLAAHHNSQRRIHQGCSASNCRHTIVRLGICYAQIASLHLNKAMSSFSTPASPL